MSEQEQIFPGKLLTPLQDAVMKMKIDFQARSEYIQLTAKLHKIKYDSLIENGFTAEQALELCKVII